MTPLNLFLSLSPFGDAQQSWAERKKNVHEKERNKILIPLLIKLK